MTPESCADLLRTHDPDRFASVMAAQMADRPRLATLYAANLDIARVAVTSAEPLISQMRLQWWADQLDAMSEGYAPTPHEIATPLFHAWGKDISPLAKLVEVRGRDTLRKPFADDSDLLLYIDGCTGTVMKIAARSCGFEGPEALIMAQARGAGLAAWLSAYPQLRAMNMGIFNDSEEQLSGLAKIGLDALNQARDIQPKPLRRAAPALFSGANARRNLICVMHNKEVNTSVFVRKFAYLRLAFLGQWQS